MKTYRIRYYRDGKKTSDFNKDIPNIYALIVKNAARYGAKIYTSDNETRWELEYSEGKKNVNVVVTELRES